MIMSDSKNILKRFFLCIILVNVANSEYIAEKKQNSVPINFFQAIEYRSRLKNGFNPLEKLSFQEKYKFKKNFDNYLVDFLEQSINKIEKSMKINSQCSKNLREFLDSLLSLEPWSLAGIFIIIFFH
jgi:hypothetical protein